MKSLRPTLNDLAALFRKLEREAYRAYHSRDSLHKADHFFNFCVTAHSMRDYYFEQAAVALSTREHHHVAWNADPAILATKEIANSAKHITLRNGTILATAKTKGVRGRKARFMDLCVDGQGGFHWFPSNAPDLAVHLADGTRYDLYSFSERVLRFWKEILDSKGIKIRRQPFKRLQGIDRGGR